MKLARRNERACRLIRLHERQVGLYSSPQLTDCKSRQVRIVNLESVSVLTV